MLFNSLTFAFFFPVFCALGGLNHEQSNREEWFPRGKWATIQSIQSATECQISTMFRDAPKTALGEKLVALRNAAIAKGMPLMTAEEISEEIARRRE